MFEQYNDLVTVEELCEMLTIGKNSAYEILASGKIRAFKHNRIWKIPKVAVINYILGESGMNIKHSNSI